MFRAGLRTASWRVAMLVPGSVRRRLTYYVPLPLIYGVSWVMMLGMPDRVILDRKIIPMLIDRGAKRVLSIGVAYYNAHHPALFAKRGVELWTIDIDPQKARWGSPGRHVTGNALDLPRHLPSQSFDAVIFNGVLGDGIDDESSVNRVLTAIAAILKPRGLLVVGWNHDMTEDPMVLRAAQTLFRATPALDGAAHLEVEHSTMIYEFLEQAG